MKLLLIFYQADNLKYYVITDTYPLQDELQEQLYSLKGPMVEGIKMINEAYERNHKIVIISKKAL